MFSWLRKLTASTPQIEDPDFGRLTYMDGYWEGSGLFPPTSNNVEYFITADSHGPTRTNRDAFQAICSNYAEFEAKARAAISNATSAPVITGALTASSLDIPAGDLDETTWEISFSDSSGTLFSVTFDGLDATGAVDASR